MANTTDRLRELQREQNERAKRKPTKTAQPEEKRKTRTRRLIQLGAIADQYLETGSLTPEETAELLQGLVQLPGVRDFLIANAKRPK